MLGGWGRIGATRLLNKQAGSVVGSWWAFSFLRFGRELTGRWQLVVGSGCWSGCLGGLGFSGGVSKAHASNVFDDKTVTNKNRQTKQLKKQLPHQSQPPLASTPPGGEAWGARHMGGGRMPEDNRFRFGLKFAMLQRHPGDAI